MVYEETVNRQLPENQFNGNFDADWLRMMQEEALKPFVSVLRLADSPAVRQRAVQSVAAALTAHPRGLGSGAKTVHCFKPEPSSLPCSCQPEVPCAKCTMTCDATAKRWKSEPFGCAPRSNAQVAARQRC
jgi:hypothetical protein